MNGKESMKWVQILNDQVENEIERNEKAKEGNPQKPKYLKVCLVGIVRDIKNTGNIVKKLNNDIPLGKDLSHIKRINKVCGRVKIIISLIETSVEGQKLNIEKFMKSLENHEKVDNLKTLANYFEEEGEIIKIPGSIPLCIEEGKSWSKLYWPIITTHQRATLACKKPLLAPVD